MKNFTKFTTLVVLLCSLLFAFTACDSVDIPKDVKFDDTGYTVTFYDDFTGNSLDTTKWKINNMPNLNPKLDGKRRACYYSKDMVNVSDGALHITTQYKDNAWHTGWVETSQNVHKNLATTDYVGLAQKYGYFEVRCKCPKTKGIWSAFWLMPDEGNGMSADNTLDTATDGCEIDVMESPYYFKNKEHCQHVIHFDGYNETHKRDMSKKYNVKNMYSEFHTYAVEWDADFLTFYIDGYKTYKTPIQINDKIYNTPQVLEYMILSVEVGGHYDEEGNLFTGVEKDGSKSWAGDPMDNDLTKIYDFEIDYVKVMQKQ